MLNVFQSYLFAMALTGEAQMGVDIDHGNHEVGLTDQSSNISSGELSSATQQHPSESRTPPPALTQPLHDGTGDSVPENPVVSPLLMNLLCKSPRPAGFDPQNLLNEAPVARAEPAQGMDSEAEDSDCDEDEDDLPPKATRAKVSENISVQVEQVLVDWFYEHPLFFLPIPDKFQE